MLISLRLRDGSGLIHDLNTDPVPVAVAIRIDGLYREFRLVPGLESAMPRYQEDVGPSCIHATGPPSTALAAAEVGWLEAAYAATLGLDGKGTIAIEARRRT